GKQSQLRQQLQQREKEIQGLSAELEEARRQMTTEIAQTDQLQGARESALAQRCGALEQQLTEVEDLWRRLSQDRDELRHERQGLQLRITALLQEKTVPTAARPEPENGARKSISKESTPRPMNLQAEPFPNATARAAYDEQQESPARAEDNSA